MARPRRLDGTISETSARLVPKTIAAPIPWTERQTTSPS